MEGVDVAYAIQQNLEHDARPKVWSQGVFEISKSAVESLAKTLGASDFGIFVFTPDDVLHLRRTKYAAVRDNVVFELGLFVGRLGIERTFIVQPRKAKDLRVPTDLTGVTPAKYDAEDDDHQASLGPACNEIRKAIRRLGVLRRGKVAQTRSRAGSAALRDLQIHTAFYGARDHTIDVKAAIIKELRKGKRKIYVGNQLGGDPTPGIVKELHLEFSYRGQRHRIVVPEGRDLVFPD